MKMILVIDDMQFCREMVAKALRRAGYEVLAAASAVEGLDILTTRHVDLIVLDNEMPQMPGLVFLRQLRESGMWPRLPVIMLTGSSERETIVAARGFGAAEYLLKSDSVVETLLARVNKWLMPEGGVAATAPAIGARHGNRVAPGKPASAGAVRPGVATDSGNRGPDRSPNGSLRAERGGFGETAPPSAMTTRARVLAAIDTIAENKTLGGVVAQIVTLAGSPRGSLTDLVAIVRQDPLISARVLHAANSAAFATAKPHVSSIEEAIRNVGAGTVHTLAMSAGVFDAFPAGRADGAEFLRCWQHALAVAALMDRLVPPTVAAPGIPYLIGLCHDLDEILLRQRFPDAYTSAVAAATTAGVSVQQVLPEIFGIDRGELVQRLLTVLGMPNSTAGPIKDYAAGDTRMLDSHRNPLVRALAICNSHANALQLASSANALVAPVRAGACEHLAPGWIEPLTMRCEIIASICALARLTQAEEAASLRPLFSQTRSRVCYVRDPALSGCDPVETALGLLCRVEVASRLPAEAKLAGVDAVIIASAHAVTRGYSSDEVAALAGGDGRKHVLLVPRWPDGQPLPEDVEVIQYPMSLATLRDAACADRAEMSA